MTTNNNRIAAQAHFFASLVKLNEAGFEVESINLSSGEILVKPANDIVGPLSSDELRFCMEGKKIDAIKSIRNRLGLGLADAKYYVEEHYDFYRNCANF